MNCLPQPIHLHLKASGSTGCVRSKHVRLWTQFLAPFKHPKQHVCCNCSAACIAQHAFLHPPIAGEFSDICGPGCASCMLSCSKFWWLQMVNVLTREQMNTHALDTLRLSKDDGVQASAATIAVLQISSFMRQTTLSRSIGALRRARPCSTSRSRKAFCLMHVPRNLQYKEPKPNYSFLCAASPCCHCTIRFCGT